MLKPQTKVGLLLIAALIAVGIVILNLGDIRLKKGYEFFVMFDDLADLPSRPVVKVSGVEVGRVAGVDLYEGRARVKVWIEKGIDIHEDTQVKILKLGLIGNTFVSLTLGSSDKPLVREGDIVEGINPISYEAVIDSFVNALDKVVSVFHNIGEEKGIAQNVNEILANLSDASMGLSTAFGGKGQKLSEAIDNINSVFSNLDRMLATEVKSISGNIDKLGQAADGLSKLLDNMREGKSTAGKLFSSEEYGEKVGDTIDSIHKASVDLKQAVNRLKGFDMDMDASVYYQPDDEMYRSYAGLTFRTSSDRYLNVSLENISPKGDDSGVFDGAGDRVNALTVRAGKKFGDFTVFGGAIRASGGVGVGWLWNDLLDLRTEIFEFTREENPWWTLSSRLRLVKFLLLGVSYEDMLENGSFRTGIEVELD